MPTYLCRNPRTWPTPLANLKDLVVKEVHGAGGYGMLVGPAATQAQIEDFRQALQSNPAATSRSPR